MNENEISVDARQVDDHCTISSHPPGSAGRIADLATHYSGVEWDSEEENSAFNC